jgi:hypothetical protein
VSEPVHHFPVLTYQAGRIAEFEPKRWRQAQGWICVVAAAALLLFTGACVWDAVGVAQPNAMSSGTRLGVCILTFGVVPLDDLTWLHVFLAFSVGLGLSFVCCVLALRRFSAARYPQ